MTTVTVGVVREAEPERRVSITPDGVARLRRLGFSVLVESGAGEAARFFDAQYAAAGAAVAGRGEVFAEAEILVCIAAPEDVDQLRAGQTLIGLLSPLAEPGLATRLADAKVTAISLDTLPRQLSRAQSMDALTSQANVAGYKAALVAADAYGEFFPMLTTAAGTTRPAQVLVIGAGIAGLQAIATARRLGAQVTAYDVRAEAQADIASTGAAWLDLGAAGRHSGAGGYARQLSEAEQQALREALRAAIARFDVVITTAQVYGSRPPVLIGQAGLDIMRPGSVVVDAACGRLGGNVDIAQPGTAIVTPRGVTVIGAGNLASAMPGAASTAFSRNIAALLNHLVRDGVMTIDTTDEIQAGVVITHDGQLVHPATRQATDSYRERATS